MIIFGFRSGGAAIGAAAVPASFEARRGVVEHEHIARRPSRRYGTVRSARRYFFVAGGGTEKGEGGALGTLGFLGFLGSRLLRWFPLGITVLLQ